MGRDRSAHPRRLRRRTAPLGSVRRARHIHPSCPSVSSARTARSRTTSAKACAAHRGARADLRPAGLRPDHLPPPRRAHVGRRRGRGARPRLEQRHVRERHRTQQCDARGGRPRRVREGRVPARLRTRYRRRARRSPASRRPIGRDRAQIRCAIRPRVLDARSRAPGAAAVDRPAQRADGDKSQREARDAARGVEGTHAGRGRRHDPRQDRRRTRTRRSTSIASRSSCSTSTASSCRRSRATSRGGDAPRAVPQSIARQAVQEKVALLTDNAGEDERFGGDSIVDAAGALGDLRAAHRQRGPRAGRAVRRQPEHRRTGSATRTSSSSSRSPASPRWRSRTRSSPSGSGARRSCAATSSATSRRSSPSVSPSSAEAIEARRRQASGGRAVQRHPRLHRAVGER